jgi:monovalent cation:H+ antiporter-2, CPA2 family
VGYLAAGVAVGPFTPGFVGDSSLAGQLAEIGVILLMFGVGLHFSLADLLAVRAVALPGAVAQIGAATLLGLGLALLLGWSWGAGIVFGLALSVASTVVLLRALEDRRIVETERGRIAVGWLIVEDLAMVIALVLLPALSPVLGGAEEPGQGSFVVDLGITLGLAVVFVAIMLVVGRRAIPWSLERVAATGSRELFTLAVLAIAMGVAFGAAELFGVSFALGAFFAGMLLNESELSHKAATDSLPLRDAFAVLFFVSVGMLFDPAIVIHEPLALVGTVLVIVVGKSLAAFALVRAFGHTTQTAFTVSVSLAQIGEFSFILAGLGLSLGILTGDARDLILAGALLSIVLNPLLFALLDRAVTDPGRAGSDVPEVAPQGHALVVGYGRVGRRLAERLRSRGITVLVVEEDRDAVELARDDGFHAVRGNVASERVLTEAAPGDARVAVFAIPRALETGTAVARLRELRPDLRIIARAHSVGEVAYLVDHGADDAVLSEHVLADMLAHMVAPPGLGDLPSPMAP